jgi:hypothetical protein
VLTPQDLIRRDGRLMGPQFGGDEEPAAAPAAPESSVNPR